MRKFVMPLLSAAVLMGASSPLFADPVTVPCPSGVCTATITSNSVNYTLKTYDDGTNFHNVFTTSSANALNYANIYFDTTTGTAADNGSNLGFEITNDRAFIPGRPDLGKNGYFSLVGSGVTYTDTDVNGTITISLVTPNNFFLNGFGGIPFTATMPGGEVSVHYSQAFDPAYAMIGGSKNYTTPNELGGAMVDRPAVVAATPEPAGLEYMALAGLSALSMGGRRLFARIRS